MFDSNVNKIFLGTDGAAPSQVDHILPLQVEGSIPYSAPLKQMLDVDCPFSPTGQLNITCKNQFT